MIPETDPSRAVCSGRKSLNQGERGKPTDVETTAWKGKKYGPARELRSSETITQGFKGTAASKISIDDFQSALVKMGTSLRADTANEFNPDP